MTTPQLLPLTILSHRIYALVLRILHNRIVAASELNSHSIVLECYHPSRKLTEPPYHCTNRATDGITDYDTFTENDTKLISHLGAMRSMYSRFRPYRPVERRRVRWPSGDIPGSRTYPTAQDRFESDTVKQTLSLDSHELFTQLVSQTVLAKAGYWNGLFFVTVEEGVVRVWRTWLRDMAAREHRSVEETSPKHASTTNLEQEAPTYTGKGKEAVRIDDVAEKADVTDESILWVSPLKNTGIRFKVTERKLRRDTPLLVRADEEDMPVSYEIEYDGRLHTSSKYIAALTPMHRAFDTNFASSSFAREGHGSGR